MKQKNISIWLFLAILFILPVCGFLLPERTFSESENRYLAVKPKFTVEKMLDGSFGTAYEKYLSDQFPFRDGLVSVKTGVERLLLKQDVNGVYFGREDYYIEKFDREDLLTEQFHKNINYLAEAAEGFAEKVGEDHVKIMMVPSASQILTDKLPTYASPADQGEIARMIEEKLNRQGIPFGYTVMPALGAGAVRQGGFLSVERELSLHKGEPIYYKTDHHWTTLGAYYAYRLYAEAAGFTPRKETDFTKDTVTSDFLGTIEAKVRVPMKPDNIVLYEPKAPQKYKVYYDGLPQEYDTLYQKKALQTKDKYSVFLDGNHGWTKIIHAETAAEAISNDKTFIAGQSPNGGSRPRRLLIIKDSYAHSFAPFVINHFAEVHMIDLRYFNMSLSEFMEKQDITDVLVLYQIPGFAKDTNVFKMVR